MYYSVIETSELFSNLFSFKLLQKETEVSLIIHQSIQIRYLIRDGSDTVHSDDIRTSALGMFLLNSDT